MRIVEIREVTKPIASPIRNAYIDFSKMTASLVAVVTDVVRYGRPVIGYGFNSNGRYGQGGLIRERFRDRIPQADPKSLLDDTRDNIDPAKVWAAAMQNEKPGGHGERSVAVGTIDMAVWDAVAKIEGKPLFRLLAERHGREADPRVFVYAAGGYYYPGKDNSALRAEMRGYLDRGYNVVKMKIGGASIAEDRQRIEAVLAEIGSQAQLAVDANGRFDLETGIAYAKMLRDYPLFWYEEVGDPLDYALQAALSGFYPGPMATGENLFSHQDARNLLRYGGMRRTRSLQLIARCPTPGRVLRTLDVLPSFGWSPPLHPAWRAPDCDGRGASGLGGNEATDLFQPYGGFPDSVRVERHWSANSGIASRKSADQYRDSRLTSRSPRRIAAGRTRNPPWTMLNKPPPKANKAAPWNEPLLGRAPLKLREVWPSARLRCGAPPDCTVQSRLRQQAPGSTR